MEAYHNDPSLKAAVLDQLAQHRAADRLAKGSYWEDGNGDFKACAVGCGLESLRVIKGLDRIDHGYHAVYAEMTGIPEMLHHLQDRIFEGLSHDKAMEWPARFMGAVQPGQDLSKVGWRFLHWLLTDEKVNPGITHPSVKDAVQQCADAILPLTRGDSVDPSAAWSAVDSAKNAAWNAKNAAENAAMNAAWSAKNAAWSAVSAAENAAFIAAWSAAESAAWSAAENAAWNAERAAWSAERAAYSLMADKLIELIEQAD